jgi:hypothetical protein
LSETIVKEELERLNTNCTCSNQEPCSSSPAPAVARTHFFFRKFCPHSSAGADIMDDTQADHQTTWANRNPSLDIQLSRSRAKLSNAERNTRQLAKAARKIKNAELTADIDTLNLERAAQVEVLAVKHNQKPAHILDIVNNATHYKKTRAPTLHNTLAHHKAIEMNEGTSPSSVSRY